ncbi:hypothetical protein Asp14428_73810 [Actinoplanes sp. NBRC 14428]|nr:hypothetical protein Asp14428_73810 [Actinoplanes sp. NBRC 14428]
MTLPERASACTGCGSESDWVHSRYTRHLADTALAGRPARIELQVRRLYCENPLCPKATFAEQVDGLTVRYQRRTPLLQRLVQIAGVLLAGRGGARLLHLLHAGLSRTSVPEASIDEKVKFLAKPAQGLTITAYNTICRIDVD